VSGEGPVVVTGAAGFIGRAVAERLLARGEAVIGVDSFTDYYDPALKEARVATLAGQAGFSLERLDIAEAAAFADLVRRSGATRIVHLAAQAGVRYSIDHPFSYEHANLLGHLSVLEACRHAPGFRHLVYASSSSVYGERPLGERGFSEDDPAEAPVSLYAATKRSGELMSAAYARLYGFPQSGLRFFTVYGPWGRPDMAVWSFTRKILAGEPIEVFGGGAMSRDFTYIDDIVDGVVGVLDRPPARGEARILNIGGAQPRGLTTLIDLLEQALGVSAVRRLMPMQPGDVSATFADVSRLAALTGYAAQVPLELGIARFVAWRRGFQGAG
jgi:UDP-glucuronate 4-epimerase